MFISVLVPTFRRPDDLRRCLNAISSQRRRADNVVVVCRVEDSKTAKFLATEKFDLSLQIVHVRTPGVVAALNAGIASLRGDVVAITDDDAAPRSDWLEKIEGHFTSQPELGGLGGRDFVHGNPPESDVERVGIVQWFGRQVGNHHRGIGAPRPVDMLKGVNMSFRLSAIGATRFDSRLKGSGAQVHNELAFSLAIKRKGWKLIYDPAVAVDHYPAPRFDEDQRSDRSRVATLNSSFNETLTLLEHFAFPQNAIFVSWAVLIGTRDLPGFVQYFRHALFGRPERRRFVPAIQGRIDAIFYPAMKTRQLG